MSTKSCFYARLTTIALCLAAASLTAACGGGGGEAGASEVDAARSGGTTGTAGTAGNPSGSTTTASAVPSDAAFACTFETTYSDCGFREQAKVAGRATMVTVAGVNAVRLHTEPGDSDVNGSGSWERNDLTTSQANTDGYAGREHIWEHSVLFPDDYVQPPQSEQGGTWHGSLVFDFHNTANQGGQANFQVAVYPATEGSPGWPTGMHLQVHAGDPAAPVKVDVTVQEGEITRNKWYNFKYHVRWADDSTGFFKAWVDGVLYMDHKGPTLYNNEGVYLKLANYHTPHGQASSVIHARVIRVDAGW